MTIYAWPYAVNNVSAMRMFFCFSPIILILCLYYARITCAKICLEIVLWVVDLLIISDLKAWEQTLVNSPIREICGQRLLPSQFQWSLFFSLYLLSLFLLLGDGIWSHNSFKLTADMILLSNLLYREFWCFLWEGPVLTWEEVDGKWVVPLPGGQ